MISGNMEQSRASTPRRVYTLSPNPNLIFPFTSFGRTQVAGVVRHDKTVLLPNERDSDGP